MYECQSINNNDAKVRLGSDQHHYSTGISETTNLIISTNPSSTPSSTYSQKLKKSTSEYDDAEDRALTANSLVRWKSLYVASAIVYSDSPENLKRFINQQTRWKKGYLRTNFYLSTFFWQKRNPLVSLIYYTDLLAALTQPFINLTVFIYEPLILNNILIPVAYIIGSGLSGLAQGLDIKFRDPTATYWHYKPLMNFMQLFILSWLLFYALWTFKRNSWMTR